MRPGSGIRIFVGWRGSARGWGVGTPSHFGKVWDALGRSGMLCGALGSSGRLWDALRCSGTLCEALGSSCWLCEALGSSGWLWLALGSGSGQPGARFVGGPGPGPDL